MNLWRIPDLQTMLNGTAAAEPFVSQVSSTNLSIVELRADTMRVFYVQFRINTLEKCLHSYISYQKDGLVCLVLDYHISGKSKAKTSVMNHVEDIDCIELDMTIHCN